MPQDRMAGPTRGVAEEVHPLVRRLLAPNPSPMTFHGTNTYLVGKGALAVIDPGPDDPAHLQAIEASLRPGEHISHIIVTHAHLDHSQMAPRLAARTGAPVCAFGPAEKGRSAVMQRLAESGFAGGGEGIDRDFRPTRTVEDGERIDGDGWALTVLHTPGHIGNHICLAMDDVCFTADHVMGWASSLVSPPDGDLTDFMASCARLNRTTWRRFLPGHGAEINAPNARLDWLMTHRRSREVAILQALATGPLGIPEITRMVYHDIPPEMLPAAERNVLAHLVDLLGKARVTHAGKLDADARFTLVPQVRF